MQVLFQLSQHLMPMRINDLLASAAAVDTTLTLDADDARRASVNPDFKQGELRAESTPFVRGQAVDEDAARAIAERAVVVHTVSELWVQAKSLVELRELVEQQIAARTDELATYAGSTFAIRVNAFGACVAGSLCSKIVHSTYISSKMKRDQQREWINELKAFPLFHTAKVDLRTPQHIFVIDVEFVISSTQRTIRRCFFSRLVSGITFF